MGNTLCSRTKRIVENPDINHRSSLIVDLLDKPYSPTPYDNEPFILTNDSYAKMNGNNSPPDNYPITPEFQSLYQSQPESFYSKVNLRPSQNYRSSRKDSVFTPDWESLSPESLIDDYSRPVYEFILKDFFRSNYPINQPIIREMIQRSLLSQEDASEILPLSVDKEMSDLFFSKFVFSENNLCKLATFLYVLIKEKSDVFYSLQQNERLFHSIVDHIYYVVNFIGLLQNYSNETERIKDSIYNSALISIKYKKDVPPLQSNGKIDTHRQFFIRIHMDDFNFPHLFWSTFAKIHEAFPCCQEIIITSCNLIPEDVYDLIEGFKSSPILKILDLSTNPISDVGLKHIESLFENRNHIETINLTCCSLTHVGVEEFLKVLSQSPHKSHLRSLSLSHNDLDNISETSVLIFTKLSLTMLELQSTNIRCQKSLFESLKLNYSLKYLDISRNRLFHKDLAYLASGLAYNSNLRRISLAMMGLSRSDCETMNNTFLMNKSLVSIDLSDNALGDEGVEILKDLLIMKKSLTEIILKRCNISLQGVLVLVRQAAEPDCRLKLLDLCYNRCPRTSIVIESKELLRKVYDILHHIDLVKKIMILLWGTIDLSRPYYEHIDCPQIN